LEEAEPLSPSSDPLDDAFEKYCAEQDRLAELEAAEAARKSNDPLDNAFEKSQKKSKKKKK